MYIFNVAFTPLLLVLCVWGGYSCVRAVLTSMATEYMDSTDKLVNVLINCVNTTAHNATDVAAVSSVSSDGSSHIVSGPPSGESINNGLVEFASAIRHHIRSIRVQSLHPFDVAYSQAEVMNLPLPVIQVVGLVFWGGSRGGWTW